MFYSRPPQADSKRNRTMKGDPDAVIQHFSGSKDLKIRSGSLHRDHKVLIFDLNRVLQCTDPIVVKMTWSQYEELCKAEIEKMNGEIEHLFQSNVETWYVHR